MSEKSCRCDELGRIFCPSPIHLTPGDPAECSVCGGEMKIPCPDCGGSASATDIVKVDRKSAGFPRFMKGAAPIIPELIGLGPVEYNPAHLGSWLYDKEVGPEGTVPGLTFYGRIRELGLLPRCLGLEDLVAMEEKGPDFVRRHLGEVTLFGWRSVAEEIEGEGILWVPILTVEPEALRLQAFGISWWYFSIRSCRGQVPVFLFPKNLFCGG